MLYSYDSNMSLNMPDHHSKINNITTQLTDNNERSQCVSSTRSNLLDTKLEWDNIPGVLAVRNRVNNVSATIRILDKYQQYQEPSFENNNKQLWMTICSTQSIWCYWINLAATQVHCLMSQYNQRTSSLQSAGHRQRVKVGQVGHIWRIVFSWACFHVDIIKGLHTMVSAE